MEWFLYTPVTDVHNYGMVPIHTHTPITAVRSTTGKAVSV